MSRNSSRIPGASISRKTAGNGPPCSGWQRKVSIAPSFVARSRVASIIAILRASRYRDPKQSCIHRHTLSLSALEGEREGSAPQAWGVRWVPASALESAPSPQPSPPMGERERVAGRGEPHPCADFWAATRRAFKCILRLPKRHQTGGGADDADDGRRGAGRDAVPPRGRYAVRAARRAERRAVRRALRCRRDDPGDPSPPRAGRRLYGLRL